MQQGKKVAPAFFKLTLPRLIPLACFATVLSSLQAGSGFKVAAYHFYSFQYTTSTTLPLQHWKLPLSSFISAIQHVQCHLLEEWMRYNVSCTPKPVIKWHTLSLLCCLLNFLSKPWRCVTEEMTRSHRRALFLRLALSVLTSMERRLHRLDTFHTHTQLLLIDSKQGWGKGDILFKKQPHALFNQLLPSWEPYVLTCSFSFKWFPTIHRNRTRICITAIGHGGCRVDKN